VDSHLTISDDAPYLRELLHAPFNQEHGAEFLVTGYVTGTDTLFEGIQQLQAGEYLVCNKSEGTYSVHRYFRYIHENYADEPEEQLIERLDDVMVGVFTRLIASTVKQGKLIVVPLSGGLDSRLVVAMLKRLGVDNVICFSYGAKGNCQAEISRRVAEALGYTWFFIEYSKKGWYDCCHSEEMHVYEKFAGNLTSVPYKRDYIAVKVLKQEGKIPDNAVFVPGYTGDMISGGHIPENTGEIPADYEQFINHTMQQQYALWQWDTNGAYEITTLFRERIQKSVGDVSVHDTESLANAIEYFNFNQRDVKWIVNSVRLYEFFGYEWRKNS
jgi:asparagine synthase (glutamine-hydrolysing)